MNFEETLIPGCFIVDLHRIEDERGFFARMFCETEFSEHGLDPTIMQINTAASREKGTLRGMHFQRPPHADNKFVRCTRGAVHDVCVDLRPESPAYCRWVAVELNESNRRGLYLPPGTAHGYQTLAPDAEILYTTNVRYAPESATGVRFDDAAFAIEWPLTVTGLSEADRSWPNFEP